MWGSGPRDVFQFGELLHYDGTSWLKLDPTTDRIFYAVWGTGKSSFVVGEGGARHTRTVLPQ
ncbi:hypothetical protein BE20_05885 [Sorangium cellulosum]|nr:hypothetical protein BE20_05885 [Sorangium cellulosum]